MIDTTLSVSEVQIQTMPLGLQKHPTSARISGALRNHLNF